MNYWSGTHFGRETQLNDWSDEDTHTDHFAHVYHDEGVSVVSSIPEGSNVSNDQVSIKLFA